MLNKNEHRLPIDHPRSCFERVIEALYWAQYCADPKTARVHIGYHPVDAMVGEMDWLSELQYHLKGECECKTKLPRKVLLTAHLTRPKSAGNTIA